MLVTPIFQIAGNLTFPLIQNPNKSYRKNTIIFFVPCQLLFICDTHTQRTHTTNAHNERTQRTHTHNERTQRTHTTNGHNERTQHIMLMLIQR